eukprot:TRINITY_DN17664_c0_g1::TRINITY_DN17664_c0_g1_i1::g.11392::m.11392 TRINITY_DN17664_c0_g1::TRINITY_DN17664_c0_g1_i1::g.11392  ORF type:complete len:119 (-),score=-10.21,Med8/PF10232.4/0.055 TRINITY_DN17664_c0_g1_i1:311-631(-)
MKTITDTSDCIDLIFSLPLDTSNSFLVFISFFLMQFLPSFFPTAICRIQRNHMPLRIYSASLQSISKALRDTNPAYCTSSVYPLPIHLIPNQRHGNHISHGGLWCK